MLPAMLIHDLSIANPLGSTGLRVSPLTLGTMTFAEGNWRAGKDHARAIFHRYIEVGGNSIDTANVYGGGAAEELLGALIAESGTRESLIVATKASAPTQPTHPNARGNGRKHLMTALDNSLKRLRTDYVDIFWLHLWDGTTPVADVMATLNHMVRCGKARTVGLSNVPAWYATAGHTLATAHGWEPPAALQMEYSLLERTVENEHVGAAEYCGMGLVPWSPLANGFLTGKYRRTPAGVEGEGRLQPDNRFPDSRGHTDQHWHILDLLRDVAGSLGHTPAQVALAWLIRQPAVATTIIGATTVEQLATNLDAASISLPPESLKALTEGSRPPLGNPYRLFSRFASHQDQSQNA
jgi:aryl-alcohol dehydrogenase-like predicted oxidoreductase